MKYLTFPIFKKAVSILEKQQISNRWNLQIGKNWKFPPKTFDFRPCCCCCCCCRRLNYNFLLRFQRGRSAIKWRQLNYRQFFIVFYEFPGRGMGFLFCPGRKRGNQTGKFCRGFSCKKRTSRGKIESNRRNGFRTCFLCPSNGNLDALLSFPTPWFMCGGRQMEWARSDRWSPGLVGPVDHSTAGARTCACWKKLRPWKEILYSQCYLLIIKMFVGIIPVGRSNWCFCRLLTCNVVLK